jgi:hypothetical protein
MQGQNLWNGYFPIRIYLTELDKCMVCNTPQDIPSGEVFKVLRCNVEPACSGDPSLDVTASVYVVEA